MIAATRWREHLLRHVPIAHAGIDPEGAHQMRVAIGRLRVWLRLGGYRVLDDDLRWLREKVGAVRDRDVGLAAEPPLVVADRLREERRVAQATLVQALEATRTRDVLAALSRLRPIAHKSAVRRTGKLAARALEQGKRAFDATDDWAALHRERRALRRLRYALEWIDRADDRIADVVGALGDLGDVWLLATQAESAGADEAYRRGLLRQRDALAKEALRRWHRARPRLTWFIQMATWTST